VTISFSRTVLCGVNYNKTDAKTSAVKPINFNLDNIYIYTQGVSEKVGAVLGVNSPAQK
jgi:hypothetical protein